jgi:hypothetical protein
MDVGHESPAFAMRWTSFAAISDDLSSLGSIKDEPRAGLRTTSSSREAEMPRIEHRTRGRWVTLIALGAACGADERASSGPSAEAAPPTTASTSPTPSGTIAGSPQGAPRTTQQPAAAIPGPSAGMTAAMPSASAPMANADPSTATSDVSAQCKGFEVLGLKYSPGGAVLPNTCAPFDAQTNNPYAIRCVDAEPTYESGFAGDQYCILPPPEDLGLQVRVGPESYDSPGEFALAAGMETTAFYNINSLNTAAHHYYRANWRMRPGGHHMLISMPARDISDGWSSTGDMGSEFGSGSQSFGGAQRPVVDRPQGTLDVPAENQGLGQQLPAKQQFSFNLHHINTSDKPVLREVWLNVWYIDEKSVTAPMATFAATGNPADMNIAPRRSVKLEYSCAADGDARLTSMYGHYHAHGERFGVWLMRGGTEKLPIYESFHWEDIPVYQFDSASMNPQADATAKVDGAFSGQLNIKAGDEIHFQCEVNNTSDQTLSFRNETFTGEMCILFAGYTGKNPCTRVTRAN